MDAKEPFAGYDATPSVPAMRGRLIKALEEEEDTNLIYTMYIVMTRLREAPHAVRRARYTLSELEGILSSGNDDGKPYDEMRMEYLKERYSL